MNWFRTPKGRWLLWGLLVVAIGALFYRFMIHDGDFDVYWASTFRFIHGLKIHVYEQNVFTYPTFASFLLRFLHPQSLQKRSHYPLPPADARQY